MESHVIGLFQSLFDVQKYCTFYEFITSLRSTNLQTVSHNTLGTEKRTHLEIFKKILAGTEGSLLSEPF